MNLRKESGDNPRKGPDKRNIPGIAGRLVKGSFSGVRKIIFSVPVLKRCFFEYYPGFRFRYLSLKNRCNLLRPRSVQWLTTYRCNFRCIHCEASAGAERTGELTTDEALHLIDELADAGVREILLSGGELLVRKDIFLLIRHIVERKIPYTLVSNGFLVDRFHEEFRILKPDHFFTSIDGLEETNDAIRGVRGAFGKSIGAMKFFASIGVKRRTINTVVLPVNIHELPEMKKMVQDSGATLWRLAVPIPVGRAKENPAFSLDPAQLKELFGFIRSASSEMTIELSEDAGYLGCYGPLLRSYPFFCEAGLTYCAIMPDGEVMGCQIAYDPALSEGNIRTRPFREIWRNGFSRFRNPRLEKECLRCRYRRTCRGGCWGMRLGNKHCLRDVWDEQKSV